MSDIDPAYHIPLSADKLQLIGEICAIQGQIEWMMLHGVKRMLGVEESLARRIMGSTSIAANADIWINCIRAKQKRRKRDLAHAERAYSDIAKLTEGRNDFVHAIYFVKTDTNETGLMVRIAAPGLMPAQMEDHHSAVAVRVRSGKAASIEGLLAIRDLAAEVSVRVAHVGWTASFTSQFGRSPWQERLGELSPLSPPKRAPRQAKARPSPPRSSKG